MVLTDHQERGFEFPGGKIERDETVEDAAMREVREETGGIVKKLVYLGQYQVTDSGKTFWKTIYFSILDEVEERSHYYETGGPVYMQELPVGLKADDRFSFIMKDEVVTSAIQFAIEQGLMS
ncbi:8-oxo-dGTPase [Bacillus sp. JCM 19046]|nr:8-oxo-dGTPase [Bacillus sp. JCM 19045]GAF15863.1 8-oxo-dGTPase [Bacillus sp. JCM 19046]